MRMTCRHAESKYTQTDAEVLLFVSVYMKATILQSYVQQRGSLPIVVYSSVDSTFFLFLYRLDCKENCEKAIEILNGTMLTGAYMQIPYP